MEAKIETQKGLYQKLLVIQQKINGLGKDKKSNTYSYVTGDKVLGEIKPLMNELGLILKQEVLSIENTRMDYKTGVGTQYEKPKSEILSKVMMRFTWIDCNTEEKDENLFGANGQNDWEKGLGSALTYAERYFLLKFFHIATDEDDIDNDKRKPNAEINLIEQPKQNPPLPSKTVLSEKDAAILLDGCKDLETLKKMFISLTPEMQVKQEAHKNKLKLKLTPKTT